MTPLEIEAMRRELAMLRYRAMAAELALYQIADALRAQSSGADAVLQKVHALNQQFPLGDGDVAGITRVTVGALRATMPGADKLTDEQIMARYLAPAGAKDG